MSPPKQGSFARLLAWSLGALLAIAVSAAPAATVQYVYDDLGRLVSEIDPVSGVTQYNYDAAGNLLSVTRSSSSQVSIVSFSPTHGIVGDTVTILGSGFLPDAAQNTVTFAGTPAVVTSATATSLVTTVPPGATTGQISVSNANGTATSTNSFIVITAPVIAGVTPGSVPRGATTRVDVSGSNLAFATAVTFTQAGIAASILPGATNQVLPVNISASSSVPGGAYTFSVTNPAGTTSSGTVTITVLIGVAPSGSAMTVANPVSVFLPGAAQVAPSGSVMTVTQPVSVSMP